MDVLAVNKEILGDAQFAGVEDFQGIPAYHFVLDHSYSNETFVNRQVNSDFYVAKEGNYLLYLHWKETSIQGDLSMYFEITETLSSINQLTEITLPEDMEEMVLAGHLPDDDRLPLPAGSTLNEMIRYSPGIGFDIYHFSFSEMSIEEFVNYYRNLEPVDGWTVSHVGYVTPVGIPEPMREEILCQYFDASFNIECVILNKGDTRVILYFDGATIRADFDWPHLFMPQEVN